MNKLTSSYTEAPTNIDRKIADQHKDIPGWGMDADPDNEPTYPMKDYTGADHDRLNYERQTQQPQEVEVLRSIERPRMTTIHGTSVPPSGLSGVLRRFAFRFSEGSSGHWLTLILADRINMIEGIIEDIAHGHFPNLIAERGWKAEWKYNRDSVIKKVAVGLAVTSIVIGLLIRRSRRNALAR